MAQFLPRSLVTRLQAVRKKFVRANAFRGASQLAMWPVALVVGIATGYAVLGFRFSIMALETLFYGTDARTIHTHAATLDWWHLMIVPIVGGLIVGQILVHLSPTRRARGIDDVIQSAAMNNGRVSKSQGRRVRAGGTGDALDRRIDGPGRAGGAHRCCDRILGVRPAECVTGHRPGHSGLCRCRRRLSLVQCSDRGCDLRARGRAAPLCAALVRADCHGIGRRRSCQAASISAI